MSRKGAVICLSFVLVFSFIVIIVKIAPVVEAQTTWYVDDVPGSTGPGDPPEDFTSIQDAINASNDGDTVFVYNGTYYENVMVNKTINLTGENRDNTIIDGCGNLVVGIAVHWVNISGFTITNGSTAIYLDTQNNIVAGNNISNNGKGISLSISSNNSINGNNVYSNIGDGIYLSNSNNNDIIKNNISNNGKVGLRLSLSSNNNISGNYVSCNNWSGIAFLTSSFNKIIDNNFFNDGIIILGNQLWHYNSHTIPINNVVNGKPLYYYKNCTGVDIENIPVGQLIFANCTDVNVKNLQINNTDVGIEVAYSINTLITENNVSNNYHDIYIISSSNTTVSNNIISNNIVGIELLLSLNNNITNNNISNTSFGLRLYLSSYNTITYNNVFKNGDGIMLLSSWNNSIYNNNIINNANQAFDNTGTNSWNASYPLGGNYWSNYNGIDIFKGPKQDIPGNDGIGDDPYKNIGGDTGAQDNYPLMNPIGNYIFLYEGWNLISLPFIQLETNLGTVLSSIVGSYSATQWYDVSDIIDHWKHYCSSKPIHLNDLSDLNHKMGFWIYITEPGGVLFEYFGIPPNKNQTITLHPGWNMVGYPSLISYNRTNGLNNLTFGQEVDSIWTYDAATQKWKEIGSSDYFEVARGYWIHAKTTCVWEVPL